MMQPIHASHLFCPTDVDFCIRYCREDIEKATAEMTAYITHKKEVEKINNLFRDVTYFLAALWDSPMIDIRPSYHRFDDVVEIHVSKALPKQRIVDLFNLIITVYGKVVHFQVSDMVPWGVITASCMLYNTRVVFDFDVKSSCKSKAVTTTTYTYLCGEEEEQHA